MGDERRAVRDNTLWDPNNIREWRLAVRVALGEGPAARLTPTELRLSEWF